MPEAWRGDPTGFVPKGRRRAGAARPGRFAGFLLHEGGPTLFGQFLAAEAVDELFLTLSPQNQILASSSMLNPDSKREGASRRGRSGTLGFRSGHRERFSAPSSCSSLSDIDSPSETNHSCSETLLRWAQTLQAASAAPCPPCPPCEPFLPSNPTHFSFVESIHDHLFASIYHVSLFFWPEGCRRQPVCSCGHLELGFQWRIELSNRCLECIA